MKVIETQIQDVLIIEPDVYGDDRGFFYESYNKLGFRKATGVDTEFVQDNHSLSSRGVLRGLHYQIKQPQGKLVRVVAGAVYDVAVDLRRSSSTFGRWVGVDLSAENKRQLWLPAGFAHGFLVTSEKAEFLYKTTDYYAPDYERCIKWNDPHLSINWPLDVEPVVSDKDAQGAALEQAEVFE